MPLAPEAAQFLEELKTIDAPEPGVDPIEAIREFHLKMALAGYVLPPGQVEPDVEWEDVSVEVTDGSFPIRIYRPTREKGTASVPSTVSPSGCDALVFYHGGGWVLGNIAAVDPLCAALAEESGCVVVSVDYRLAPEYKFPIPLDDCYAALRWTVDHADSLGIDPKRIAVGGDSAGGNLAAAVSLMARDREEMLPAAQILIYPVTDYRFQTPSYIEHAEGTNLTLEKMQWFWDQYLDGALSGESPYASVLRAADFSGLPPTLVQTAGYDPLRDEGERYAVRLREAGVTPVTMTRYDGMIHGFIKNFRNWPDATEAFREIVAFLKTVG